MLPQLVQTKLYVPSARPNLVSRQQLVQRLEDGVKAENRLILVSAPAGSGKTTLLGEWTAHTHHAVAWLSLEEQDNDPVRFWTYLLATVQRVYPGIGQAAAQFLHSPQADPGLSVATVLCNDLGDLHNRTVLVLDDYHTIATPSIHAGVAFLVEHLPPQCHLAIATRADPPLPLARLRARGLTTELRAADLRFSGLETAAFLNEVMGLDLRAADVAALEARTEGWIVGLQLAALSMQGRQDVESFIQAFAGSHHYILEYLTEEVLKRQPEPVQRFLVATSILDRLCGPLCDAVTGNENGEALLDILQRANLFVIPLDDDRRWFRYHHLFADLLGSRLKRTAAPQQIVELHRRAARWHEQNDLPGEAIRHALTAGDFEHAGQLLEQFTLALLTRGEMATLLAWMGSLPRSVVLRRPWLCISQAWALAFAGQLEEVEPLLDAAEENLAAEALEPNRQVLEGNLALIRALVADMSGQVARAIELAERARDLLPPASQSLIPHILGRAYRSEGELEAALKTFGDIARIGEATDNIWTISVALCEMATTLKIRGRLREAAACYDDVLRRAAERGAAHFGTLATVGTGLADLLLERNELESAQQRVEDSLDRLRVWRSPTDLVFAAVTLARVRLAQGDSVRGRQALVQAEHVRRESHLYTQAHALIDGAWVRLWLAEGNLAEASRWADARSREIVGGRMMQEAGRILRARVWIAQGRLNEGLSLLNDLTRDAEARGRIGRLIEILILQAVAEYRRGDTQVALEALSRSLALAAPEEYARIYLDEGEPVATLLRVGWARGLWRDLGLSTYTQILMAAFGDAGKTPRGQALPEPLSERELEVLRLVAAGCSNQEIARRLVVTLNTVKKHTSNLFDKLGVASRTQAIARARELGLIE